MSSIAQNQKGTSPPVTDPDLIEMNTFLRNDAYIRPYSSDEIQRFCDYIKENPVTKELKINDKVPFQKIRVAQFIYRHTKDENLKRKILDLMMGMFKDIQVARDALGVDPLSKTESWLYVDPPLPGKDPGEFNDLKEKMKAGQLRLNELNHRSNLLSKRISDLRKIHAYLYRAITVQMKVPLEGIPPTLERSPAEKARTKDMLEKQAAALGRKKPDAQTSSQE